MLVFLYEFVTGGGFLGVDETAIPEGSLLREGRAMWSAIGADLLRIPNTHVVSTLDARLAASQTTAPGDYDIRCEVVRDSNEEQRLFHRLAEQSDFTLLIAPETDNHLLSRTRKLQNTSHRLLNPNAAFISITANKTALADTLAAANIRTPPGKRVRANETMPRDFPLPAVLKVNDGAGSMCRILNAYPSITSPRVMRVEQFVEGLNCSMSFLCGGAERPIACPLMEQILSADEKLEYLGGRRILDSKLEKRAADLGKRALAALPATTGYVGIDFILGKDNAGADDYVIEVNPRLTTSYVGLRRISNTNLGGAMIQIAQGAPPDVSFSEDAVHFLRDGTIL